MVCNPRKVGYAFFGGEIKASIPRVGCLSKRKQRVWGVLRSTQLY